MINDNSAANLNLYLKALSQSVNHKEVAIKSYWPGVGKIVTSCPGSAGQTLLLFLKTLNFSCLEQAQKQFLSKGIRSLNIYQKAVKYEFLASLPKQLLTEREFLLKIQNPPWDKEMALDMAGWFDDVHSTILGENLRNSTPVQQKNIYQDIQQRIQAIPKLVESAQKEADEYFEHHKKALTEFSKSKLRKTEDVDSLFEFFVKEKPRPEMEALYQQITESARIWERIKDKKTSEIYDKKLRRVHHFFEQKLEEFGPARDVTNGISIMNLFSLQKRKHNQEI